MSLLTESHAPPDADGWARVTFAWHLSTYHENFDSFRAAIDNAIQNVNTTLRDELASLFSLNFQTLDTKYEN